VSRATANPEEAVGKALAWRTGSGYEAAWRGKQARVRARLRGARGRSLNATIQTLNPVLRGWAAYFKLAETKRALEERDRWIRHKLRCVLW